MLKDKQNAIDNLFKTPSKHWDKQIAFSVKDISVMLNIPESTISQLCREQKIRAFKIGNKYRIKRYELFKYIEDRVEDTIIL